MTIKVKKILNQFNLNISLNEDMLNVEIYGDVKFTGYRTEYHHNIGNNKEELVYVVGGVYKYDGEDRKVELIINPNKYYKGKIIKEMVRYDVVNQTATLYNEEGHAISLKHYFKNLSSEQ